MHTLWNACRSPKLQIQIKLDEIVHQLNDVQIQIEDVRQFAVKIYEEFVDARFQDDLASIESSYEVFLKGAHNLEQTLASFEKYIVELETKANHGLKPSTLETYFRKVSERVSWNQACC